MKSGQFDRSW